MTAATIGLRKTKDDAGYYTSLRRTKLAKKAYTFTKIGTSLAEKHRQTFKKSTNSAIECVSKTAFIRAIPSLFFAKEAAAA